MFDRARALAGNNPQLVCFIEEQHTRYLVANNNADELAARGNAGQAIEMYAAQGNWDKVNVHRVASLTFSMCSMYTCR